MTLASEVANMLDGAHLKHLNPIETFFGPITNVPNKDKATAVVYEVRNVPIEFGSNNYVESTQEIQLKILYKYPAFDVDVFENSITSLFISNGWIKLPDSGHYPDNLENAPVMAIDLFFRRRK